MHTRDQLEEAFELLDELILKGRLDQKEQEALRLTAVLQMQAHAAEAPVLAIDDRTLLALLLSRWGYAITDREGEPVDDVADTISVSTGSLARVLRRDREAVEHGLGALAAADIIGLSPTREDGSYSVNFAPLLGAIAPTLVALLYREFVDREGRELHDTASYYFERIGQEIDELREWRSACPHLRKLRDDYADFKRRVLPAELLNSWPENPRAVYAWLRELADFEDRYSVLSGTPSNGLQAELVERATKRSLILGRHLEPPAAPANAA